MVFEVMSVCNLVDGYECFVEPWVHSNGTREDPCTWKVSACACFSSVNSVRLYWNLYPLFLKGPHKKVRNDFPEASWLVFVGHSVKALMCASYIQEIIVGKQNNTKSYKGWMTNWTRHSSTVNNGSYSFEVSLLQLRPSPHCVSPPSFHTWLSCSDILSYIIWP